MNKKNIYRKSNLMKTIINEPRVLELIELGRNKNFLTYKEINNMLPLEITDPELLGDVLELIKKNGIIIKDDELKIKKRNTELQFKTIDELLEIPRPVMDDSKVDFRNMKFLLRLDPQDRTDKIVNRIILQNMRLVHSRALYFWKIYESRIRHVMDEDDLVSYGILGLRKAIKRYNFKIWNTEFSTYAVNWIDQSIKRNIDDNLYRVRIPIHFQEKIRVLNEYSDAFSDAEKENIEKVLYKFNHNISLDRENNSDDETLRLIDIIKPIDNNYREFNPEYKTIVENLFDVIINVLETSVKKRYLDVFVHRYGLVDGYIKSLEETGLKYDVTRERVRQICEKCTSKLLQSSKLTEIIGDLYTHD